MKKTLLSIAVAVVALAFALPTYAQTNTPATPPAPKKPTKHSLTGEIKSLDAAGKTLILVDRTSTEKSFILGDNVRVSTATIKKAALSDLKVGDKVKVVYVELDGKLVVRNIVPPEAKKPATTTTPAPAPAPAGS